MTIETPKSTIEPKSPANATPAAKPGCCGGEATPEFRNNASECAGHEHHAHAAPSKAAPSSCCCSAAKESDSTD